jgi:zinc protease
MMMRSYLVPSFATGKRGESAALEVLAHILGAGSNSRLYRDLVVDKRLAVSAGAYYDSSALDMSKFSVFAVPLPGIPLADAEKEVDVVLAQVVEQGVTAEELERSKTRLIADAVYAHDSQASMARWYGSALMTGATVADVTHWPDRIRAVTAQQVQDAARQWFDLRRSVTGYLIKDSSPQVEKRS